MGVFAGPSRSQVPVGVGVWHVMMGVGNWVRNVVVVLRGSLLAQISFNVLGMVGVVVNTCG